MSESPETITLVVKWAGKEYPIENLALTLTVSDLKREICEKTNVLPERQKLLNLRHKGMSKAVVLYHYGFVEPLCYQITFMDPKTILSPKQFPQTRCVSKCSKSISLITTIIVI
jgi:hypothetical protein